MKTYILFLLLFLGTAVAQAQGQLGVQLSPSISINRVYTSPNNAGFSSAGWAPRFKLGVIYDYPIKDRYYVSTGLLYSTQHLGIKNEDLSPNIREKHVLRYLQVPLFLRLYTNEFMLDTRLYVALGVFGQIRIHARNTDLPKGRQQSFLETFRRWGWGGLLGVGVEYQTSLSTSIFVGISYYYGLSSVIDKQAQKPSASQVMGYSDMLGLDLGVRF